MTRVADRQISSIGAVVGDVLTWDGTKWVPQAPSSTLNPPADPGDNGKFPQAQSGNFTYITASQLTVALDIFTDTTPGLVPASGGGTTKFLRADGAWTVVNSGLTPPVGGTGEIAYAVGTDLSYASDVKIVGAGTAIAFGVTPAATGDLRFGHGDTALAGRNLVDSADVSLLTWGVGANNRLTLGSTDVVDLYYNVAAGASHVFQANSATVATLSAAALAMAATPVTFTTGYAQFGTNPAATGNLRFAHNTTNLVGRNSGNTTDVNLLQWGVTANNRLTVGSTGVADIYFNVATGNSYVFQANSSTLATLNATALALSVPLTLSSIAFGVNPATAGLIRVPHSSAIIEGRDQANSADSILFAWGAGANNRLTLGDALTVDTYFNIAPGSTYNFQINTAIEYTFSSTVLDFTDNRAQFGTNPSTTGLIAVPHNSVVIAGRNSANSADVNILRWGAVSNTISFGSATVANLSYNVTTGGVHQVQVNSSTEYQFDSVALTMNNNNLLMGTGFITLGSGTAPTSGDVRLGFINQAGGGHTFLRAMKEDGTTEASLIKWNADAVNTLAFGASPGGTDAITNLLLKATSFTFNIAGANEYTFSATTLDAGSNDVNNAAHVRAPGFGAALTGFLAVPHNTLVIEGVDSAGGARQLLRWGVTANDAIVIGEGTKTSAIELRSGASTTQTISIGNTAEYVFSSTIADFKDNRAQFGTNPSTTGLIAIPHASVVVAGRNNANSADANVLRWGAATDTINLGSASVVAGLIYGIASGTHQVQVAGTDEYTYTSTTADFKDNVLQFGTNPASAGTIRLPNSNNITWRNNGNTANIQGITVATDDAVYIGESTNTSVVYLRASGDIRFRPTGVGGDEFRFSSTFANFLDNVLLFGTNPAASGLIRVPNATAALSARNAANSADVEIVRVDASNVVVLGGTGTPNAVRVYSNATTNITTAINGTDEYVFSSTAADFKDNSLQFGTNPAATGLIRVPHGTNVLYGRNQANSADSEIIRWGQGSNNLIIIGGGTSSVAGVQLETTTGTVNMRFAAVTYYEWDTAKMFVKNTSAAPGDPSGGAYLYAENGALKGRGSSGTVTTFAPAEPHCPRCGSDFAIQYSNPKKYGEFSGCMLCLNKALKRIGIAEEEWVIERKEAA